MNSHLAAGETEIGLSVVVPCYNEEKVLRELHRRLSAVCRSTMGDDFEIVLVNDGSKDSTWALMQMMSSEDPHIVAVNLARNHGHQLALSAGLSVCRGQRILIVDADLQDPPELLPEMMALMDQGADIVYGQREKREGESWLKRTSASAFYRLLDRMVDVKIPLDTGDFRLISRRSLNILNGMPERHRFIRGMISWIGLKQVPLRYNRQPRFAGETKYPLRKMIALALDAITSFSIVPLRFASHLGMILGALALVYLVYVFVVWARGDVVEGWTSVTSIVLIIGSIQLFVIGIIGEYLGRMFMEVKQRPMFIIADIVASNHAAKFVSASSEPSVAVQNKPANIKTEAGASMSYPVRG
ncbi:MAG TPA: glycosyltransferase family 2 protein [Micropepsaceae bacterium]|jgi:dolichol-phosphate mannosyltransferase|nr:glycosyltransferase family 2 protein [Micropepsaceae bacterium]